MALEALGVAANVAGLIDLGLSVCHGLWEYYGTWKSAETDVKRMYAEIESLTKIFAVLKTTLARSCLDPDMIHRVEEIVSMCEDGILCLRRKLQKIRDTSQTASGLGTKFKANLQRALYPFKESTVVKLRGISRELQERLLLALNILQVDSINTSAQSIDTISSEIGKVSISIRKVDDDLSHTTDMITRLTNVHEGLTFKNRYKDPQKHNVLNMLGCLLQQLMLQSSYVCDEIAKAHEHHRKAKTQPSIQDHSALLRSAVGYFAKTTFVVDALDECQDEVQDAMMEEINRIPNGVSVLVTSRHSLNILPGCQTTIIVRLRADDTDIKNYLDARIDRCKSLRAYTRKDNNLHGYVVSSIVGKAKGMFLLARLQFDAIMAKPTLRKIKSALKDLPEELDSMYDQAFERIQNQDPEFAALAMKLLCWTHYAFRPLKVDELRHAVAIEPGDTSFDEDGLLDENLVESICAGLLTIQENDTVGLVHYTAQEYLERHSASLFPGAHTMIVQSCLVYLSFDDFQHGPCLDDESFLMRCATYPLVLYASQHWTDHLRYVDEKESHSAVLGFLSHKEQLRASVQAAQVFESRYPHWSQDFAKDVTGLWLASSYGLSWVCTTLLEAGDDPEECDSHGQAPLHRAAIRGSVDTLQILLAHKVNIESQSLDFDRTALHWAAWHGHQGAVDLLIASGASVQVHDRQKWTALHLAASQGQVEILHTLLLQKTEINAKDGYGATPLYRAADGGHEAAVRILLDNGALTDIANDYNQTPLHRAADLGRYATAQLLLESGAAYDLKDYYGWTPLYRAADHGHNEVANLLADFAEARRQKSLQEPMTVHSGAQDPDIQECASIQALEPSACGLCDKTPISIAEN
ncbi:MAG: hypothetical protein Q9168_007531 [Polycauliona sp. 1 TL-2023]